MSKISETFGIGVNSGGASISASVTYADPASIASSGFPFASNNIVPSQTISGSFDPDSYQSYIEFFIYDYNKNIVITNHDYKDWQINENVNTESTQINTTFTDDQGIQQLETFTGSINTDFIEVNPIDDVTKYGINTGDVYTLYNFITTHLGSNAEITFFIDEISSNRTEVRLKSNEISDANIEFGYNKLKNQLDSQLYFDEFYINLFANDYATGVNILLDKDEENGYSVLIKLAEPLQAFLQVGDQCFVCTKQSETVAYSVNFIEDFSNLIDTATYIKGPNINISLQELVNNSTPLQSKQDLLKTESSSSLDSVLNYLNKTGVAITPNYSYDTFNEFINFSSAKSRINNFYEKVSQIQSYQADIDTITSVTPTNPNVIPVSTSLASLQNNITDIISNFDGYENYLYYTSSVYAYPKTGDSYPFDLLPTDDPEVLEWMGSDVENSQYYGGYRLSASLYDEDNQNWLWYTIPEFIKENSDNDNYITFANMVGQSFDEVWLYTRALSERFNTTNNPETGLPLDLAAEAIKGLGFETFGNNYDNQNNFIGLTGEDNESYVPPTGSELITKYVAINDGKILNYWDFGYSWADYVEEIVTKGFPYAIDKVSKEIYKRLYHNMAYLTKKKGTISGLRQLINIWGIPNTILRINEFGGKNRDNTDDYDLWYKRYSYAYTPVGNSYIASSSVKIPWMPLERNYIAEGAAAFVVPDGVAFRFKTTGYPTSSYAGNNFTQSLAVKKSNGINNEFMDWGIKLSYEVPPVGTYNGAGVSDFINYGKINFYMSASVADGGVQESNDIYLPFFDGGWWTVLLQRDKHVSYFNNTSDTTYTLRVANKQVNGWDGNSIGWSGDTTITSVSQPSVNDAWNKFGVTPNDGVYLGGYVSGSTIETEILNEYGKIFSGSLQEFRYYSFDIGESVFNDLVMNPESIEGNAISGSQSSFDIVNFRAPLGNELEFTYTASQYDGYIENISSSHPAITGSAPSVITGSFINPSDLSITSSYEFIHYTSSVKRTYSKPNVETYFLDQPSIGIRNRVSNKIQVTDGEVYGNVLSKYRSIQQDYLISESYTEDITSLEVGFSPQDEVNDDIIASFGYGVISDTLADPRFAWRGDQDYYPKLRSIAEDYFRKYTEGNVWDYIRLIKYFDNSIFKAIKSYVPARTNVNTGVIIKQHMLERNRRIPVTVDPNTIIAYTPEEEIVVGGQPTLSGMNSPISYRNLEITGSIKVASITGSNGGVPPDLKGEVSGSGAGFNIVALTQSWTGSNPSISGSVQFTDYTQDEFFNGEYSGSEFPATTQSLLNNPFLSTTPPDTRYAVAVSTSTGQYDGSDLSIISTYPRYNIAMQTFAYTWNDYLGNTPGVDIDSDIEDWAIAQAGDGENKALIVIVQGNNTYGPKNFFPHALILPAKGAVNAYSGNLDIGGWQKLLGIQLNTANNSVEAFGVSDIPLPPIKSGGMWGITGEAPLPLPPGIPIYQPNNTGPYFKFDLDAGIGINKFFGNNSTGNNCNFITSPALGNKPSSVILSTFLGRKDAVEISFLDKSSIGITTNTFVQYKNNNIGNSTSPTIRIQNGTSALPMDSSDPTWLDAFNQSDAQRPTYSVFVSNFDEEFAGKGSSLGIGGWYQQLNNGNGLGIGSGSLYLAGTTWTGSYGDSGNYVPYGLMLNNKNYEDDNTTIIDNTATFNNPFALSFDFDIINDLSATGTPATIDSDGLPGNKFVHQKNKFIGKISLGSTDPNRVSTGFNYGYIGQQVGLFYESAGRYISGSVGIYSPSSGFGNLYVPGGPNPTQVLNFYPNLIPFFEFYNTPFNPLINNATESVENTYLQVVEYDDGPIPSNIIPIIENTALKARVPDSFYTQKSSILPRYVGSTLQSANYNFPAVKSPANLKYSPGGATDQPITFLNAFLSGSEDDGYFLITGSDDWGGDSSYGTMKSTNTAISTIFKAPIYFAHFKTSYYNQNNDGTYTFEIDALIESPLENIKGNKAPNLPEIIKIDGNDTWVTDVRSTFEVDRKVSVAYTNAQFAGVNYGDLKVGTNKIFQGAAEYLTIGATTTGDNGVTSSYITPRSTPTMSFFPANWGSFDLTDGSIVETFNFDAALSLPGDRSAFPGNFGNFLLTGSDGTDGYLLLNGDGVIWSQSFQDGGVAGNQAKYGYFYGPGLGLINSINHAVSSSTEIISTYNAPPLIATLGVPKITPPSKSPNPSNRNSYITQNFSQSSFPGGEFGIYGFPESVESGSLPFLIQKGDELVCTFNTNPSATNYLEYVASTKVYTVVEVSSSINLGAPFTSLKNATAYSASVFRSSDNSQIYNDRLRNTQGGGEVNLKNLLKVYPDPSKDGVIRGQINSFIIRRRNNAGDRVIVYQTPPNGQVTSLTGSGEGYLIPGDFTPTQKRNVQSLISQLKAKNTFEEDNINKKDT